MKKIKLNRVILLFVCSFFIPYLMNAQSQGKTPAISQSTFEFECAFIYSPGEDWGIAAIPAENDFKAHAGDNLIFNVLVGDKDERKKSCDPDAVYEEINGEGPYKVIWESFSDQGTFGNGESTLCTEYSGADINDAGITTTEAIYSISNQWNQTFIFLGFGVEDKGEVVSPDLGSVSDGSFNGGNITISPSTVPCPTSLELLNNVAGEWLTAPTSIDLQLVGDNEPSDYSGMAIVETFTAENFNIDCDDLNEEWLSEHPELMTCQDAFNFIFNTASGTFVPNGDGVFQDDYIFNAIDVSAFNPEVFANGGFIEWVQTQCYECGGESVYCHTLTVRIFENEIEVKVDPQ